MKIFIFGTRVSATAILRGGAVVFDCFTCAILRGKVAFGKSFGATRAGKLVIDGFFGDNEPTDWAILCGSTTI